MSIILVVCYGVDTKMHSSIFWFQKPELLGENRRFPGALALSLAQNKTKARNGSESFGWQIIWQQQCRLPKSGQQREKSGFGTQR